MAVLLPISVVIPTYRREGVLLDTLACLLALDPGPSEILVIDQTEQHELDTTQQLEALRAAGRVRVVSLAAPSIPCAMNRGLKEAKQEIVLFLDDDIRPESDLIAAHFAAHSINPDVLVAGRVIQPWEEGVDTADEGPFQFSGLRTAWVEEFMGGNFSIARKSALALGGFDENFVRVAYRFEAEFAHRLKSSGRRIRFAPDACLHHLKATGGTRTFGDHLRSWKPNHAVGAYYHALRTKNITGVMKTFVFRPIRSVSTRHHLRQPWWIPVTLVAEFIGILWAIRLAFNGPRYVNEGVSR